MKAKVEVACPEARIKGMTLAEHKLLGAQLVAARNAILHLSIMLNGHCKSKPERGRKEAVKTYIAIDSLRYQLENKLHEDFQDDATLEIYSGQKRTRFA